MDTVSQKKRKEIVNGIAVIVTIALFSSFFILMEKTYGRYIYISLAVLLLFLATLKNGGKLKIVFPTFLVILLLNCLLFFLSSLWAWDAQLSIISGRTVLMTGFYVYCIYIYYRDFDSVEPLLNCIVISSFIVAVYTIRFFGISFIVRQMLTGRRLTNDFINVNSIGMLCAFGIIITLYKVVEKKNLVSIFSVLLLLPIIVVWGACGSKKSIIMIVLAVMIYFYNNQKGKDFLHFLRNLIVFCFFAYIAITIFMNSPFFSAFSNRIMQYIDSVLGKAGIDSSDALRNTMIEGGMSQFVKNPILGIGMGNSIYVNEKMIGRSIYLHNNFVDILVNVGIIGFVLYYLFYLIPFGILNKNRGDMVTGICFLILIVSVVMDYGMVSMFDRETYFYIMMIWLQRDILKKKCKV